MQKSTSQLLRTSGGLFGEPGSTLTPERAGHFVSAFATEHAGQKILAAADHFPAAQMLQDAIVPVLEDAGCDVLEMNSLTAPAAQFLAGKEHCSAGLYAGANGIRILTPPPSDAASYWASLLPDPAVQEIRRAGLTAVLDCCGGAAEKMADAFGEFFEITLIRTSCAANAAGKLAAAAGAVLGLCWNEDGTACRIALPGSDIPLSPYQSTPLAARMYLCGKLNAMLRNCGNDTLILEDFVQRHGGILSATEGDFTFLPDGAFSLAPVPMADAAEMSAFYLWQSARGTRWDNVLSQLYPYHTEVREIPLETPRRHALLRSLRGRFGDGKATMRSSLNFDWNDGRISFALPQTRNAIVICSEAKKRKVARERLDLACKLLQSGGIRG